MRSVAGEGSRHEAWNGGRRLVSGWAADACVTSASSWAGVDPGGYARVDANGHVRPAVRFPHVTVEQPLFSGCVFVHGEERDFQRARDGPRARGGRTGGSGLRRWDWRTSSSRRHGDAAAGHRDAIGEAIRSPRYVGARWPACRGFAARNAPPGRLVLQIRELNIARPPSTLTPTATVPRRTVTFALYGCARLVAFAHARAVVRQHEHAVTQRLLISPSRSVPPAPPAHCIRNSA